MSGKRVVAIYPYTGPRGEPRLRKVRHEPKGFRMSSVTYIDDKGKPHWTGKVIDKWLSFSFKAMYQLPTLIEGLKLGEPVYWPEGERDADTLTEWGVCSTSTWQGASEVYRGQCDWFAKYGNRSPIKLLIDWDVPGGYFAWLRYQTLTEAGVDPARIEVLAAPYRQGIKDVTDAAELRLSLGDLVPVGLDRIWRAAKRYADERHTYGMPLGSPPPQVSQERPR